MHTDDFIAELWEYANSFPMREHPWFRGIAERRWSREQIIAGEVQHYLRVRREPRCTSGTSPPTRRRSGFPV